MKISKVITLFICGLALVNCMGCNKTNEKNIVSDKNKDIFKTNSEIQSDECNDEYKIKANLIYYVLKDEYFENNDEKNPKLSILVREFICYDGVKNDIYPDTRSVALDKVNTIEEFRRRLLQGNANSLKLPPKTIVGVKVLNQWKAQHYDDTSSYSEESPRGLSYTTIQ